MTQEAADELIQTGIIKAQRQRTKTLILSILAGAFIALGAYSSLLVRIGVSIGFGKFLAGIVFSTGLIMITLTGAELFTGNVLMTLSFLEKKITACKLFKNWFIVYFGNFIGAMIATALIVFSTTHTNDYLTIANTLAHNKVNLSYANCLLSGILCNWLVCMAVYMAQCSKNITGKIFGIVFPISIFIIAGYEHCVANMFFIPCGIISKYLLTAGGFQITLSAFIKNMIPVTLGNIAGAFIFVALPFWKVHKR